MIFFNWLQFANIAIKNVCFCFSFLKHCIFFGNCVLIVWTHNIHKLFVQFFDSLAICSAFTHQFLFGFYFLRLIYADFTDGRLAIFFFNSVTSYVKYFTIFTVWLVYKLFFLPNKHSIKKSSAKKICLIHDCFS
jgi:hypothetical protein